MDENQGTKDDLVAELELRARWRLQRAAQSQGDQRDTRSADALHIAATEVAALPGDHPLIVRLAQFYAVAGDDAVMRYLKEQNRIMSKHGYEAEDATTEGLLSALADAAEQAAG